MNGSVLLFVGLALFGLFISQVESRCPSNKGTFSICSFTTCSAEECAAKGLECCPKSCGGSSCVKGVVDRERRARGPRPCPRPLPPVGGCRGGRPRITCSTVFCAEGPCCMDACGKPYCLNSRG